MYDCPDELGKWLKSGTWKTNILIMFENLKQKGEEIVFVLF